MQSVRLDGAKQPTANQRLHQIADAPRSVAGGFWIAWLCSSLDLEAVIRARVSLPVELSEAEVSTRVPARRRRPDEVPRAAGNSGL
jgi:hypothetical protein